MSGAMQHAQQHAGDSGDEGIFSNVLGFLGQNKQHIANQEVNEQRESDALGYICIANSFRCRSVSPAILRWWWKPEPTSRPIVHGSCRRHAGIEDVHRW